MNTYTVTVQMFKKHSTNVLHFRLLNGEAAIIQQYSHSKGLH